MNRFRDKKWNVGGDEEKSQNPTYDGAQLAVLMDIREELQAVRRILQCGSFTNLPFVISKIEKNTKPRRRKSK